MKEFWIYYDDPSEPLGVYIGEKKNDGILKHTKVIEFSAYEEAIIRGKQLGEDSTTVISSLAAALDKVAYMDGATLDHLKQIARTALKSFKDSK